MAKSIFSFFVLFTFSVDLLSQTTFQRSYYIPKEMLTAGYYLRGIHSNIDGSYVVMGARGVGYEYSNAFLIKTNETGEILWAKTYAENISPASFLPTSDGGFLLVGTGLNKAQSTWQENVYLIKTDGNGDTLWSALYGWGMKNTLFEGKLSNGYSIIQTDDKGYLISGATNAYGAGYYDIYLIKIDTNGKLMWTKIIGDINQNIGGPVLATKDKGFILAGSSSGNLLLMKMDSLYNSLWSKTYGISGVNNIIPECIKQTSDGGYILTSTTDAYSFIKENIIVLKIDSAGNVSWARILDSNLSDWGGSIIETVDGGFVTTGAVTRVTDSLEAAIFIKFKNNGDTVRTNSISSAFRTFGKHIIFSQDGGYAIAGNILADYGDGYNLYPLLFTVDSSGNMCKQNGITIKITTPSFTIASPTFTISTGGIRENHFFSILIDSYLDSTYCLKVGMPEFIIQQLLFQIFPNPAVELAVISFHLAIDAAVSLCLYDMLGNKVSEIINEKKHSGQHEQEFDVSFLPSGVYLLKLKVAGQFAGVKKLVVNR